MKRLIYVSALFLGLLAMSCTKDGVNSSIVGIWNYSDGKLYSDGNLVPTEDWGEKMDMDNSIFEFKEDGELILTVSVKGTPFPISGKYTLDNGILEIRILDAFGVEQDPITFTVQKINKTELILETENKSTDYYKDGVWSSDENESHSLKAEARYLRQ